MHNLSGRFFCQGSRSRGSSWQNKSEEAWSLMCTLLLGDSSSGRADLAPDRSECTCGFGSFAVVEMSESGRPNPPSHYLLDVLQVLPSCTANFL